MVAGVKDLKQKVIQEFKNLLCKFRNGYKENYEFILEEISFINSIDSIDDKLYLIALQYYLNNKWQTQS